MISGVSWEFRLNSRRIQASNPENSGFKLFEINNLYESNKPPPQLKDRFRIRTRKSSQKGRRRGSDCRLRRQQKAKVLLSVAK
jgi:hypothetical protein